MQILIELVNSKYNVPKAKKPETKAEILQKEIEDLVKRRNAETDPIARQKINAEITMIYSRYERLKL